MELGKTIYFENKPGKPGKILIFWNLYASSEHFWNFNDFLLY